MERDKLFRYWLHEQGYTFIGDTSIYKLTLHEMRDLHEGFNLMNQLREDKQKGVTASDRQGLQQFNERLKK